MILLEDILLLHFNLVKKYGGADGIRDNGLLESAIVRPFQTFGGEELYPSPVEKAAALAESLIANHPFIDGNKRTGFLAMAALLIEQGITLTASQEQAYDFSIKISTGHAKFEQITEWLKANTKKYELS